MPAFGIWHVRSAYTNLGTKKLNRLDEVFKMDGEIKACIMMLLLLILVVTNSGVNFKPPMLSWEFVLVT